MKTSHLRALFFFLVFMNLTVNSSGIDSLKYCLSLDYYRDLSDTYGGGNLFGVEFRVSKTWYGAGINLGLFQSQPTFILKIPIEETGQTFEIPFDEISNMQIGTISGFLTPIKKEWFSTDLIFGISFGQAQSMHFTGVDYNYSIPLNRFTYIKKDYQLVKVNHFGYQAGFCMSLHFNKKLGLQIKARMQDLSNGGTFLFVGTGLCFKL